MPHPDHGAWKLPANVGDELFRMTNGLDRWLRRFDAEQHSLKGAYVAIEAPWIRHGDPRNGQRRDKERDAQLLFYLAGQAGTSSYQLGATPREFKHDDMMKLWCGSNLPRSEGKAASIASACAMGWDTDNDNVADALGLLFAWCHIHRVDVPWNPAGPMFGGNKVRAV